MSIKEFSLRTDGDSLVYLSTPNFRVREFASKCGSDVILIDIEHVIKLQRLRNTLGRGISVVSGYRTREHNSRVGGAPRSQHVLGTATDIRVSGMTPLEVLKVVQKSGLQFGGIGLYDNFLHLDSRNGLARWNKSTQFRTEIV